MAKQLKSFLYTLVQVLIESSVYVLLLLLIMIFFTGNGQFIYEGF